MKIIDNVIKLDCTKGYYAYAVIGDERVTLIDTSIALCHLCHLTER